MNFPFFDTEVRKVLSKISKEKACEELADWIKPCIKHLHWSATSTFSGNGRVIWAKFKSFLSHVVNRHTGLDDPLFNKCGHGELQPRKWLRIGMVKPSLFVLLMYRNIQCTMTRTKTLIISSCVCILLHEFMKL